MIENFIDYISNEQLRLEDGTLARNRPMKNSLWLDDLFMSVPALAPAAIPLIPTAIVIAALALATARLLCEMSRCRIPGAIGWALKWAIVIGAVITLAA